MKQRLSTLIDLFARDRVPALVPALVPAVVLAGEEDESRQRHGASMRPERLRERRGARASMRRGDARRATRMTACARRTVLALKVA